MRLHKTLLPVIVVLASLLLISCEHRELMDISSRNLVRVYLDEQIKNVTCGFYNEEYEHPVYKRPVQLRAMLCSPESGEVIYESTLRNHGEDEHGYYIEGYIGGIAGEYTLLAYQIGSSTTLLKNTNNYYDIYAYTNQVAERVLGHIPTFSAEIEPEKIVVEPEHMLAAHCDFVQISDSKGTDTLKNCDNEYLTASSIAKSYYLQLRIRGVEYVSSAAALLNGMSGSIKLCDPSKPVESDKVNLFFDMQYANKQKRASDDASSAILYTTFTTFGKIDNVTSVLMLNFEFTKSDGTTQVEQIDLTQEFYTQLAIEKQWIILDKEIVITPPINTSGGMTPGVDDWEDIDADIIM